MNLRGCKGKWEARVESSEGAEERDVFCEYRTGNYRRQFTISDVIDQSKIQAELKDGVPKLRLPKIKAATPRKIEVKS